MENWSDWEREEFWRMMREMGEQIAAAMREDIAGLHRRDEKIIEAFRSRLEGRT